jgi:DNA-binding transcriptional MocR family regulator
LSEPFYASRLKWQTLSAGQMAGNIEGSVSAASEGGSNKNAFARAATQRDAAAHSSIETVIDFRRSLPPAVCILGPLMNSAFAALNAESDLSVLMHGAVAKGTDSERLAGARLMAPRLGFVEDLGRITPTNGTQSALLILFKHLVGENRFLYSEALSYGALCPIARLAGVPLRGLPIDDEGIDVGAFQRACAEGSAGALYCNPTVHNPTTSIMGESRRLEIAQIARRYGVPIIEDDALGRLHLGTAAPIAKLASDICWYVMTASKCLAHGLRLAYFVAPSQAKRDAAVSSVEHLSFWNATPLITGIVRLWTSGTGADVISRAIFDENRRRESYARQQLEGHGLISKPSSMHVWLPLPETRPATEFVKQAEALGVLLRPAQLFAVGPSSGMKIPNAVRLSLSTPGSAEEAKSGIDRLKGLLEAKVR